MRIAHLVSHGGLNGVASSTLNLIRAQLAAGHEVMLASSANSWIGNQGFDRPIKQLRTDFKTRPREIWRIGQALRAWNPDVIHCHGSRANKYGMVYRIVARSPVVTTAHNKHVQLPWMFFPAVIAPSTETADFHVRTNFVRRKNVHVIRHFMPLDHLPVTSAAARKEMRDSLGVDDATFLIGNVGQICPRKNQVDSIRMLRKLVLDGVNAKLVLVGSAPGDGEAMEGWKEAIGDPLVASRVILTGHRDDALEIIAVLDAFVLTSLGEEGPIVALEAMALHLPVVAYRTGQLPDLIENGKSGWVIDKREPDALAAILGKLAADPALRQSVGDAARERITTLFNADNLLPQIDAVYRKVSQGK